MKTTPLPGLGFLLAVFCLAGAVVLEAAPYKVLVFSKTSGFRHDSIPAGQTMLQQLGSTNNFTVDFTENAAAFNYTNLTQYKAVVWLSTTGDVLDAAQQTAFEQYIRNAGGFVGIHSASDTEYSWPWYGQLVGAYFSNHPPGTVQATVKVADPAHPSTATLPRRWSRVDEWYNFRATPRGKAHILATVDETTYAPGVGAMGFDHPIAWCRNFDGGRALYTALGHTSGSYSEPAFRQHVLGGIEWAAGVKAGDAGATIDSNYQQVIIDPSPQIPMELAVAPDGRVFIIERGGRVKIWKPDTSSLVTAAQLSVFSQLEDGLLGITLDPGFATNHWVYLYYSPVGPTPKQHLSRFTLNGDVLDLASEKIVLQVPTQRDQCCHSAGSLTFGPDGSLYLSVGDNTNPFESSGFNPIDERSGRSAWDAQKSSSNPNDLRGKILRILPQPDGTYTIPPGNLFPPGTPGTRPEIYVMGNRNPFRIAVDQVTGWLYWGEVGPDSDFTNSNRGPVGHDEWNQARSPGNYGWPYFLGNNFAYRDYNFATGVSGPFFNPAAPVNDSPNNTGLTNLPPARPAWIWTQRAGFTPEFPELPGQGWRCAMGGPIYHFNPAQTSSRKLPAYFDNTAFIYEWAWNFIWEAKMDSNGDLLKINRFLPTMEFHQPMDMELGPEGALYVIDWGLGNGISQYTKVYRIEYVGGNRAPIAVATATPDAGAAPLLVQFSSAGSSDPEGNNLSYAWSFFGDAVTNSTAANPSFTYPTAGNYRARLTLRDSFGNAAVADVAVTVGNRRPVTEIIWPPEGAIFDWGATLRFAGSVYDAEDGATTNHTIPCSELLWGLDIGHDTHSHGVGGTNGCSGVILAPATHGSEGDNLALVLRATYTDKGASPAAALKGEAVHMLQPRRKQAEHYSTQSGITNSPTADAEGKFDVTGIDHGDYITFSPVNFANINALTFRVASTNSGSRIEVRQDGVSGALLATAQIPDTGGGYSNVTVSMTDPCGTHQLFLVFLRNPGDADLFRLNWLEFTGDGATGPVIVSLGRSGDDMVISFPHGPWIVEYAEFIKGPWLPVTPSPTSPFIANPAVGQRFYRLRWP